MNKILQEQVIATAKKMCVAAITAPKARGEGRLEVKVLTGQEVESLGTRMIEMSEEYDVHIFERDGNNVLQADAVFLIGTRIGSMGIKKCGMCGFKNCNAKENQPTVPCVFNSGDLGIAMGSAVSIAMDNRVDNRIMYTAGQAAMDMGVFGKEIKIAYGVPLAAKNKNPFFDRK